MIYNMIFSKEELSLLQLLIEDKLEDNFNGPEALSRYWKPEILIGILKKIDKLYYEST
jgi:hypothetical protein